MERSGVEYPGRGARLQPSAGRERRARAAAVHCERNNPCRSFRRSGVALDVPRWTDYKPSAYSQEAVSEMAIQNVTEATFEQEVLQSELPVLVDLWADWCAPCKALEPRVAEVAREFEGRLKVVKINVDQSPRLAQMFQARSIPMLVLMVGGRVAGALQGAVPKHEIVDLVSPHLPGAVQEIPAAELFKLIRARQVVVVDVREPGPFARAHVPGALNIPVADLEKRLLELMARRRPVVVYDRSSGDEARNATKVIEATGLPVMPLKGGFLGWEAEGLEIERSS